MSKGILPKTHHLPHAWLPPGRTFSAGAASSTLPLLQLRRSDSMGNCSGKYGPSACGSLGYAFADAMKAKKVVVITDHLMDYPLTDASITEDYVDYVVNVPAIGDPLGIVSGTTRMPKDPIALQDCRPRRTGHRCFRSAERWLLLSDWCRAALRWPLQNTSSKSCCARTSRAALRWAASRAISSECWKPDALPRFRTCSALT